MKKNNKKLNSKKGFTLVELIVAIGVFVIIMGGSAGVFASAFKSYKGAKNINENLKNAQYAMNLMSKTFRTSSIKSPEGAQITGNTIVVYDYSQESAPCIRFRFNGGNLTKAVATTTDYNECSATTNFGSAVIMTTGAVDGFFYSTNSVGDESSGSSTRVGAVTVMMTISNGTGANVSSARIQSTSSLRDYEISNVGFDPNNEPI